MAARARRGGRQGSSRRPACRCCASRSTATARALRDHGGRRARHGRGGARGQGRGHGVRGPAALRPGRPLRRRDGPDASTRSATCRSPPPAAPASRSGSSPTIALETGPAQISREAVQRAGSSSRLNVRGRDVASFVAEAQAASGSEVQLPAGYYIRWGGQFENLRGGDAAAGGRRAARARPDLRDALLHLRLARSPPRSST